MKNIRFIGINSSHQCLRQYVSTVLGNHTSSFQCIETTQCRCAHLGTYTLIATPGKILLDGSTHFQQHALKINFVPCLNRRTSQLHDHQGRAIFIILDCPLARHRRWRDRCLLVGRYLFDLPAAGPMNLRAPANTKGLVNNRHTAVDSGLRSSIIAKNTPSSSGKV
jgi:hypothetical protein